MKGRVLVQREDPTSATPVPPNETAAGELMLPPFGSLVAGRKVIVSNNTNFFAVEDHFFIDLMHNHLKRISFDSSWYLRAYPDVQSALDAGAMSEAQQHYIRFGYFEHRLPRSISVSESFYLNAYVDVREAIRQRKYASAQEHFMLTGFREGRLPYEGFTL